MIMTEKITIIQTINKTLFEEMARDPNVIVMGEDVGRDGGVFRATDGLWAKFGEERVIDTPLAESGIIGTAIGMAIYGLRPVCEMQFDGFTYEAFHQIRQHLSWMRARSQGRFSCPIVIRAPYGGGIRAFEHHSELIETTFACIPGLKVVCPSTPYDTKGLLLASIRDPDPVLFLEPKRIYRAFREDVPDEDYTVEIGKAKVAREGEHVSLFAWGAYVRVCLEAAERMAQAGINCEVVDVRTLNPLDDEMILNSVKKTGRAVVVHEAPRTMGLGAEIVARINEKALTSLQAPVLRVTAPDIQVPLAKTEHYFLPDAYSVMRAVQQVMSY